MSSVDNDHREQEIVHDGDREVTINDLAEEIDNAYVVRKMIGLDAARKLQGVLIELSRAFPLDAPVEPDAVRAFREKLQSQVKPEMQ